MAGKLQFGSSHTVGFKLSSFSESVFEPDTIDVGDGDLCSLEWDVIPGEGCCFDLSCLQVVGVASVDGRDRVLR